MLFVGIIRYGLVCVSNYYIYIFEATDRKAVYYINKERDRYKIKRSLIRHCGIWHVVCVELSNAIYILSSHRDVHSQTFFLLYKRSQRFHVLREPTSMHARVVPWASSWAKIRPKPNKKYPYMRGEIWENNPHVGMRRWSHDSFKVRSNSYSGRSPCVDRPTRVFSLCTFAFAMQGLRVVFPCTKSNICENSCGDHMVWS